MSFLDWNVNRASDCFSRASPFLKFCFPVVKICPKNGYISLNSLWADDFIRDRRVQFKFAAVKPETFKKVVNHMQINNPTHSKLHQIYLRLLLNQRTHIFVSIHQDAPWVGSYSFDTVSNRSNGYLSNIHEKITSNEFDRVSRELISHHHSNSFWFLIGRGRKTYLSSGKNMLVQKRRSLNEEKFIIGQRTPDAHA